MQAYCTLIQKSPHCLGRVLAADLKRVSCVLCLNAEI